MDLGSADEARAVQSARGCCSQPRRDRDQPEGGDSAVNPGEWRSTRGSGGQPGAARSRASRTVRSVQEWRAELAARGLRA